MARVDRGYEVEREGDKLIRFLETGFPREQWLRSGICSFNLPARRKFLRGERSELNLITSYVTQAALAFPGVKFVLVHNNRQIINCPGVSSLEERVYQLYGHQALEGLMAVGYEENGYRLSGLASRPFTGGLTASISCFRQSPAGKRQSPQRRSDPGLSGYARQTEKPGMFSFP